MLLDLAWWHEVRWRSDYEGHQSKETTKEFKILFIGIIYKARWKAMKKKAFIWLLSLPTFLHLRMTHPGWDQKFINFNLQWEEELDFLHAVAIQAGQQFQSNHSLPVLSSRTAKICITSKILCVPFPVNRFFNWRLTNIEVGFILQQFLKNTIESQGFKSTWKWFWTA